MVAEAEAFINLIFNERHWSWSLAGIVFVIAGIVIRGWFLNSIFREMKHVGGDPYDEFRATYLRHALIGWFFFVAALLLFVAVWNGGSLFREDLPRSLSAGACLLFYILSVVLHVKAAGHGAVAALKRAVGATTSRKES